MTATSDPNRPPEIEPPSNRLLVHRLSAALLPVALRAGVHPNTVTMTGLACGVLAALAYWHWRDPLLATLGFVAMIGWHVMDGLDGQLARASGKTSDFGRLLDGIADYSTFVLVYLALALSQPAPGPALLLAVAGGVAHIGQSLFYEAARATYIRRRRGRFEAEPRPAAGGLVERLYNRGEALLGNRTGPLDHALAAASPTGRDALWQRWTARSVPAMRLIAPLSANGRTIAIWVACMIGDPRLYWWWEIAALTLLALVGSARLRQAEARALAATQS